MKSKMARAIDDLAYIIECAALDYTGELRSELISLCRDIRSAKEGYDAELVKAALEQLESGLDDYRKLSKQDGALKLVIVSRAWRKAFMEG